MRSRPTFFIYYLRKFLLNDLHASSNCRHFMKPPNVRPTHFICLPLRSSGFRERVTAFTSLLPNTINPTIVRPIGSLHFTLGVLSLKTPAEIDAAVDFLHSCHAEVVAAVQAQKVTVALRGIASMQQNLKNTSVVYAVPEEGDGRLRLLSSNFLTRGWWLTCATRFITIQVQGSELFGRRSSFGS